MTVWWYVDKDEKIGTIERDKLKQLFQSGKIGAKTLLWQEGMDVWRPLDEVEELNGLMKAVPPPLPLKADPDPLSYPLATRWPRFLARIFDVWWETLLITIIMVNVLSYYFTSFDDWINRPGASLSIGILSLPIALVLDALLYRIFGNTPGKALLGLKVERLNGKSLSLTQYSDRNFSLWSSGLAFGFPLFNLFTMARQWNRLGKGLQASYDVSTVFRVCSKPSGWVHKTVFGFALAGLFTIMLVLNIMEQKAQREDILRNNQALYYGQLAILNEEVSSLLRADNYDRGMLVIAQDALQYAEEKFGPDDLSVTESLNNLAKLYLHLGDYAEAEPLFRRSLAITEKAVGSNHLDLEEILNNLALLYLTQSDFAKAEPLLKRSLAINEKTLSSDHPDLAWILSTLAFLYLKQGDYAKAEPLFMRSLVINEKALGPDHPDLAWILNNLAKLNLIQSDYAKAEPLFKRSLTINEKALGPHHPDLAEILSNLALLYLKQGDYVKAEPLFKRSLAIDEKTLDPDYTDVAKTLNNLAKLYRTKGDYAKAESLLKRSLAIKEKVLGPDHPDVATSLENLAVLYRETKHVSKAKKLEQRAAKIRAIER
ncbi:MAG: tetratricopeptide repeat protein [Nitrosomonadaceae bacterium]|nr:tetratricopeptide repeat protein [Nitrosomonadaceae bacterium]